VTRLVLLLALSGCVDTIEDRFDELDRRVEVDCGEVSADPCRSQSAVDYLAACLRDNLAAGVYARASQVLDYESTEYIYTSDRGFVSISGFSYLDTPSFTEYRCGDVGTEGSDDCLQLRATNCTKVRDW
jgi:hypothetical protein